VLARGSEVRRILRSAFRSTCDFSRASASSHRLEIEIVPNPGVRGPVHCYMMNLTLDYLLKSIYKVSVQSPDADTRRGNEKGCLTSE